jgi:hypothetical protein
MISGTTLEFVESIGLLMPFTLAVFLPIHNSIVVEPRETVTFLSVGSQLILPPSASTIALIGTRVLLFLITGGESRYLTSPLTVKEELPILRTITV